MTTVSDSFLTTADRAAIRDLSDQRQRQKDESRAAEREAAVAEISRLKAERNAALRPLRAAVVEAQQDVDRCKAALVDADHRLRLALAAKDAVSHKFYRRLEQLGCRVTQHTPLIDEFRAWIEAEISRDIKEPPSRTWTRRWLGGMIPWVESVPNPRLPEFRRRQERLAELVGTLNPLRDQCLPADELAAEIERLKATVPVF